MTLGNKFNRRDRGVALRAGALALFTFFVGGCGANNDGVNDALRKHNDELQREIDKVTRQLRLRETELATLRGEGGSPVAGADLPVVAKVEFGRYSGGVDTNRDEIDDTLRIYLNTFDQKGRFIVVAGEAVVQAVFIKPGASPTVVIDKKFSAADFDKAFRSGITGTHYTLDAPLPKPTEDMKTLMVKVTVTDATTGKVLSVEQPLKIRLGPM